jgi:hypothetical protein
MHISSTYSEVFNMLLKSTVWTMKLRIPLAAFATVIIVLPDRKTKACQGVSRFLLF